MNNNKEIEKELLIFGMKNLLLEKKLEKIEKEGTEIGHRETIKQDEGVDTELFEFEILKKAKKMANFYVLYYSLENSIRKLIKEVLYEKYGETWWKDKIPPGVQESVKKNLAKELNSARALRPEELDYTNFGELIDIINGNWKDFSGILRSQKAVENTLSPLNDIRSVIAHSCELEDDEIARFELLIKDWLRIQN